MLEQAYAQEVNHKTLGFGKMNLYIHNIINAQLAFGDTQLCAKFKENEGVKQFDIVVANPPWNQDGYNALPFRVLKKKLGFSTFFHEKSCIYAQFHNSSKSAL